jgi:hypothetical protein
MQYAIPCDMILFEGIDTVSSFIFNISPSNHVGIIVNKEILPEFDIDPNKLYVLESINDKDLQIRDLSLIVQLYARNDGKLTLAKLCDNPYYYNKELILDRISFITNMYLETSYLYFFTKRRNLHMYNYQSNIILTTLEFSEKSQKSGKSEKKYTSKLAKEFYSSLLYPFTDLHLLYKDTITLT